MSQQIPRPSFTLGITGDIDPNFDAVSEEVLRGRLKTILLFIRYGVQADDPREKHNSNLGAALQELLPYTAQSNKEEPLAILDSIGLKEWGGVGDSTEIVLLTTFAPGAATIAADTLEALNTELPDFHGRVRAALPFPKDPNTSIKLPEDTFQVYLRKDLEPDDALTLKGLGKLENTFKTDLSNRDQTQRNLRHQAAGEYVATFSDLLIAIYDDLDHSDASASVKSTVESRRNGSTPGLLPFTDAFTWSDNGPTLHLYQPRGKAPHGHARIKTPLRILHPYELGPSDKKTMIALRDIWGGSNELEDIPGDGRMCAEFYEWQSRGNAHLCRVSSNLVAFNALSKNKNEEGELLNMCGRVEDYDALSNDARNFVNSLDSIARIRRRSSDESGELQKKVGRALLHLFLFSFLAASLLHGFAHWHSFSHKKTFIDHQSTKTHATTGHEGDHASDRGHEPKTSQEHSEHDWAHILSIVFGAFAFILPLIGLHRFSRALTERWEEEAHDFRALAEGIRVQFYWAMCGLRRSVPSNYMQRVRSEMDWIRNAISAMSFPYENAQKHFLALGTENQIKLIKMTSVKWLSGQIIYFENAAKKKHDQLHKLHSRGSHLALTGLLCIPLLVFLEEYPQKQMWIWEDYSIPIFGATIGYGLILLASCCCICFNANKHESGTTVSSGFADCLKRSFLTCCTPHSFKEMEDGLFHHDRARDAQTSRKRHRICLKNFGTMLIPCAGLALALVSLSFLPSRLSPGLFPGPIDLGIIITGICLVGGALMVAYAEKQLLPEHEKQYDAAAKMFKSARMRLEDQIQKLEDAKSEKAYNEALRNVHQLLFALGKEALDENSEWLVLHRARPMEPVMAG